MARPKKTPTSAKLVAFRDITEDLREERKRRKISVADEFAPTNYVIHEKDICESLDIPDPDFRMFNGGARVKKKK